MQMKQFHIYLTNVTKKYPAHPLKERQHGIKIADRNMNIFWNVTSCNLVHKEKINNAK
jgi:hypothetical protein